MTFTLKDKNNKKLFTGTKQECMHFIKCRKYSRHEVTLEPHPNTTKPHYTVPVTSEPTPKKAGFFKRIFN